MSFKKWFSFALALALAFSFAALAENDDSDLQSQLDAANARIEELEAEVELYRPFYEAQIVATFGEDGIIWLEDAQAEYRDAGAYYAQFGLSIDDYAEYVKPDMLASLVEAAVLDAKAEELGLTDLDEETRAGLEAEADENFETYVSYYVGYVAQQIDDEEQAREATIQWLAQQGVTREGLQESMISNYVDEQLHAYITADVTVSDEDVQAAYDEAVASDEAEYADDYTYATARAGGELILWNPEGYRAVKHVLITFDADQSQRYQTLQATQQSLEEELAALDEAEAQAGEAFNEAADAIAETVEETGEENEVEAVEQAEEEAEAEVVEEAAEAADVEAEAEAVEEVAEEDEPAHRSREEIEADMAQVQAELDALYEELMPTAQQVIDEFEAGTDFDELIETYGQDPGMKQEPTASEGYAVAADSVAWDPAFTAGAMSIENVGEISGPVYGSYGIHIIYYMADITPGPVPFDEELAETLRQTALEEKIEATYEAQVAEWVEEAHPVYYLDRF